MGGDWRAEAAIADAYRAVALDRVSRNLARIQLTTDTSRGHNHVPHLAAESAYWLCAIDESLWDLGGYSAARDADVGGQLLPAIRYARNAATHSLVAVVLAEVRSTTRRRATGSITTVHGVPTWIVDAPALSRRPTRRDVAIREAYVANLAGKPVVDALRAALTWLRSAVNAPEPTLRHDITVRRRDQPKKGAAP